MTHPTPDEKPLLDATYPKNIICSCGRKISFLEIETPMKDLKSEKDVKCVSCIDEKPEPQNDGGYDDIAQDPEHPYNQ